MKRLVFTLIVSLLIYACSQNVPKPAKSQAKPTSHQSPKTSMPKQIAKMSQQDSIEQSNNASVLQSGDDITKAFIFLSDGDSTIYLTSNMQKDHRVFGYAEPNLKSERLLLLSIFTTDVERNPFGLRLGAFYDTNFMTDMSLKYVSEEGKFIKASAFDKKGEQTSIYFEKKWIDIR